MKTTTNKVNTTQFINNIIKRSQDDLLIWLPDVLRKMVMPKVYATCDYVFGIGDVPVLLVCHLDTVHKQVPQTVLCQHGMMWSPEGVGGDDRCGVYAVLEIIKRIPIGKRPFVLFTTDEEIGGIGISKFTKDFPVNEWGIKFSVEYDRKGFNDLCFYSTYDQTFIDYVVKSTGYIESYGSYTDIVDLMDVWDLPGVNMSVGYYNAHTTSEYIVLKHLQRAIDISVDWLANEDFDSLPEFSAMAYKRPTTRFDDSWTYRGSASSTSWFDEELCVMCATVISGEEYDKFDGMCAVCHSDYYGEEFRCKMCGDYIDCEEYTRNDGYCSECDKALTNFVGGGSF